MNKLFLLCALLFFLACEKEQSSTISNSPGEESLSIDLNKPYLSVLGVAQDAGFPQAGCKKACCEKVWKDPSLEQKVVCLGLSIPETKRNWMFEATPDFPRQLEALQQNGFPLAGIFISHAHIGHYTGLMYLGREAMGADSVPVHVLPRMRQFLEQNGPWSQLIKLKNISLSTEAPNSAGTLHLGKNLKVRTLEVPHRDEFSETGGFLIQGPSHSALFIPDIDKWGKWSESIVNLIREVDYAFLDGTFFANGEIPGRDMSEIPHPFVEESMELFNNLSPEEKSHVYFIHFNHTNPLLDPESEASKTLKDAGYPRVKEGMKFPM